MKQSNERFTGAFLDVVSNGPRGGKIRQQQNLGNVDVLMEDNCAVTFQAIAHTQMSKTSVIHDRLQHTYITIHHKGQEVFSGTINQLVEQITYKP